MAPRQRRLSERLSITPGTRRNITGEEFADMQAQAIQLEQRATRADELEQRASLTISEPDIYAPGSGYSWFADVGRVVTGEASGRSGGVKGAGERLAAHERFEHRRVDVQLRRAQAEHALEEALTRTPAEAALYTRWRAAGGELFEKADELAELERRAINRTDGSGGYFAPPGFLIDEWIHSPRAGAPLAGLMNQLLIPPGVQNIQVPQFATGGGIGTGVQTADGGAVTYRDPREGILKANLETLAVNLDVSMQLLDQTPIPFDDTFGRDIAEDFATQLDGQLLLGNGTAGQVNGVIPGGTFSAANAITLTSTNNAASQSWITGGSASYTASADQMTAQLYAKVSRARGLPPEAWLINPSVWAIICGTADTQLRPLVTPGTQGKTLHGIPVVEDNNIPETFGGATTAPSITVSAGVISPTDGTGTGASYTPLLLGRWSDMIYFSGEPKVRVMPQALAGTLQVRYQVTQYIASMPARIVWGGSNVTYSGTSQSGGVNTGAACAYGTFNQHQANGPLSPSGAGY
jgi:HK97 family phage major capsid protein